VFTAVALLILGLAEVAPVTAAEPSAGPNATLVGFRKTGNDSALVYVQLSAPAEVRSSGKGKTLTFTLKGVSVPKKTNTYPLVATHFGSIVDTARLVPGKRDTDLVIVLRREAKASAQVVRAGEGAVLEVNLVAE
jgi:hypothetical protein